MCNDNQLQIVCKIDVIFLKLLFLLQLREVSHAYLKKKKNLKEISLLHIINGSKFTVSEN